MKVLEYYDDERVKRESGFFNKRNLRITAIVYTSLLILFAIIVCPNSAEQYEGTNVLLWFLECSAGTLLSACIFLWARNTDMEPRSKLEALKNEYVEQRKAILEKHKYKYSVYKGFSFMDEIDEEIMCDSFYADENGHVYIDVSEDNYVLGKPMEVGYHHITDNSDGHILTVREIRKFVKTGESQDENN